MKLKIKSTNSIKRICFLLTNSTIFAKDFNMKYHKNAIKVGFRIFCFNAEDVSSINIHGANFLATLSIDGAEYGVSIAICGLKSGKITQILINDIEDAGIMLYDNLISFFEDETNVHQANFKIQNQDMILFLSK